MPVTTPTSTSGQKSDIDILFGFTAHGCVGYCSRLRGVLLTAAWGVLVMGDGWRCSPKQVDRSLLTNTCNAWIFTDFVAGIESIEFPAAGPD